MILLWLKLTFGILNHETPEKESFILQYENTGALDVIEKWQTHGNDEIYNLASDLVKNKFGL